MIIFITCRNRHHFKCKIFHDSVVLLYFLWECESYVFKGSLQVGSTISQRLAHLAYVPSSGSKDLRSCWKPLSTGWLILLDSIQPFCIFSGKVFVSFLIILLLLSLTLAYLQPFSAIRFWAVSPSWVLINKPTVTRTISEPARSTVVLCTPGVLRFSPACTLLYFQLGFGQLIVILFSVSEYVKKSCSWMDNSFDILRLWSFSYFYLNTTMPIWRGEYTTAPKWKKSL